MALRSRWLTAFALGAAIIGFSTTVASAAVPAAQMKSFKALEGPFSAADSKFTAALSVMSNPTVAQVKKPSSAFVPALKTFDAGLLKIGFTGKAATDVKTVVSLNTALIGVLSHIKSVASFETGFGALQGRYVLAQQALAKDLGVPSGDVII
jgi:hypothetical protein